MISRLAILAAALLFAGCGKADKTGPAPDETTPSLDGKWKVVKAEMRGEDVPVNSAPIRIFEFNGKQYLAIASGSSAVARAKLVNTPELRDQRQATLLFVFAL